MISIKCRKCGAVLAVTTGKDSFRTVKVLLCKCGGIEIDLEIIRSAIERVYVAMNKRLEVYVDLNKTFGVIKEIKIMGEELMTIIVDNSVYGSSVDNTITDNEWNAPPK